ncbi:PREDICTED: run domain Beclin-1 interacting and cysteine-rich containing protein [Ceratosolen solmsi marchali]|uniref:Run domain Beclin-1 interacting and cysteine-rich containing protein n=1 Tax=Ceratosolen solmsi marchali TaxID=326594 RepID=A0AAJ6YWM5_9HYME|nr:PREDICTED: run domain Beclin-1 interacting and cysteine-rich containing protein [Ceratosolen solmsi marchali]
MVVEYLMHPIINFSLQGEPDCWSFIQGLNWLQPSLATSPTIRDCDEYHANLPNRIISHKDILWLYKSLEDHSLSQKLSWLLSDKEHILSCLEPWSFLCQGNLAEATLVCLRAVEKNEPALLTEIDPSLFLPNWSSKDSPKGAHRRSSSYPVNLGKTRQQVLNLRTEELLRSKAPNDYTPIVPDELDNMKAARSKTSDKPVKEETSSNTSLKAWSSFPELNDNGPESSCGGVAALKTMTKTMRAKNTADKSVKDRISQSIELSDVIKVDYSETKAAGASMTTEAKCNTVKTKYMARKGRKVRSGLSTKVKGTMTSSGSSDTLNYEDSLRTTENSARSTTDSVKISSEKPKRMGAFLVGSAPEFSGSWSLEVEGQKDLRTPKKSFIEDGGSSVLPMATGYFPRPKEGQSLTSFLSSAQFARANAELDRENAHFSISEAMIAAIEQLKCNRQLRLADEAVDESDEEINNLKQRIRLRRRQRQEERRKGGDNDGNGVGTWTRDLLSDGKTDTTTTDQSISPLSTSPGTPSESISTDDVDDYEMDDAHNLSRLKNAGLSVSMASLYSEADLFRSSPKHGIESNLTDSIISAEGVALSLISRFSEKHLPRASELKWLVSEQDAPQRLLPLPKSWPVSPDDAESGDVNSISLRGTIEWAPPRPQIIFTAHPPPVRRILIAKQNYRCAGCGMKVAVEYANRFRYCEYLGRYFCTGCHTNQVTLIPGKILTKWDFNRYPVSNFSYRLLDQMTVDPLFQVSDLNPTLYRRIKQLDRTKLLRTQLFYLKDFLFACRFATNTQETLKREPNHIIADPHIYSIQDFTQVKAGVLPLELNKLVQECHKHVAECVLCQARGFVCELCNSKDVIYPWELNKVMRCESCGTCYHKTCISANGKAGNKECKRCSRLQARRRSKEESCDTR